MRLDWGGPKSWDSVLISDRREHTEKRGSQVRTEAGTRQSSHKPRIAGAPRIQERQEGPSPGASGGGMAPGGLYLTPHQHPNCRLLASLGMTPAALRRPACGPLFQGHGTLTLVTTLLCHLGGLCLLSAEDVWFHVKSRGQVAQGTCYQSQGSQIPASPMASTTPHPIRVDSEDLGPMPGGLTSLLSGFPSRCWGLSVTK